jgi:UDP-N-acetyl-2-amino-2-deoxyglucuronate dehydrogenase
VETRFALIGCGRIAQRHAVHMCANGRLLSVCDVIKEKADAIALQYGAKAFYSIDEFLRHEEKADVAAVCTPNGLHAEHSIRLLDAGVNVLCEKPMAISVTDCRAMIAASERSDKNLFVVKQNRFNPPLMAVKKIIDEGRLGKIYSLQLNCFWNRDADYYLNSWKGTLALDGGTLFTQFSHFIDLLYWMIGDVKNIKAILANYAHKGIIEFEDTGAVIVEFENGITGTINYTVNSYKKNMEGSITFFGEKGTVKVGGQYLNKIDYQDIENYTIENIPEGNAANYYGNYLGSMSNHDKVYENMINFLQNKEPVYISCLEGMKTVEIIEKIYKAAVWI